MSASTDERGKRALAVVREQLVEAIDARKCHACGCLHETVEALAKSNAGRDVLASVLDRTRAVFTAKEYDCLGCPVCYPAIAANAFGEAFPGEAETLDLCPAEGPVERRGWPPLPGDYRVVGFREPVAVCTLNSGDLADRIAKGRPDGVAIVGTLHTENLGIERIIRNVLANPHIRFFALCGEDTRRAIGHLPGQSLRSLLSHGVDDRGRIAGARGKRPVLKNMPRRQIEAFRRQVDLVELIGEEREAVVLQRVRDCASRNPGPFEGATDDVTLDVVEAREPQRLVPDPAGFFVVYPDRPRRRLVLEHYTNAGVLDCVLEGVTPAALCATAIERRLVSRIDHAAYLGSELSRAQRAMETGEPYVQDRAHGEVEDRRGSDAACDCGSVCTSRKIDE